jgi:hypothetical protein
MIDVPLLRGFDQKLPKASRPQRCPSRTEDDDSQPNKMRNGRGFGVVKCLKVVSDGDFFLLALRQFMIGMGVAWSRG